MFTREPQAIREAAGVYMKAWAGDPVDQRDLGVIAKALGVRGDREAYDIVRRYSSGELSEQVQILLESLFE